MNSVLHLLSGTDKRKLLMRVNMIIIVMTIFLMQVSASGLAQKVTLNEKETPLENVMQKIRIQTGYDFIIDAKLIANAKRVTVNLNNVELTVALNAILKNQQLSYAIEDHVVAIKPKESSFIDNLYAALTYIDVRGRVVDNAGNPLAGASVVVKGGARAASTGTTGFFLLQSVNEDAILIISYTGYKTREIPAAKNVGIIRMDVAVENLQEVGVTVNTGYQRIRPEQSTGAVSQMSTKEFESRISTNFLDGLVNRLPGLMINNNVSFTSTVPGSSSPTSRSLFNIRGISTMSANQSPLIVIDGYPTELTMEMIDPNEIESVTILKDAAAATVYGVRASNGVIVIQRKQAVKGKLNIAFRATSGITPREDYNRYRWAEDASAIVTNFQRTTQAANVNADSWRLLATSPAGTARRFPAYYVLAQAAANVITPEQAESKFAEMASYDNREDYSRLFLRPAVTNSYNFNASGGNDNALYYITASYTGSRKSQINNDYNRFSLSGRSTLKFTRRLSLELTTEYQEQRFNDAPVPLITSMAPYERFQDGNGNPSFIIGSSIASSYNNVIMSQGLDDHLKYPLVDVNEISDKRRTVNNRIAANFNYAIGGGLDLAFGGIYEASRSEMRHDASDRSSETRQYVNSYVIRNPDGTFKYPIPKGGFLRQQAANTSSYTARIQLNYNKKIAGVHSINAILGTEVRNLINKSNTASYFGYSDETLLQQPVDYNAITTGAVRGTFQLGTPLRGQSMFDNLFNQQFEEDRFLSGYANLVYAYKKRYSLTGSIRIDQSNLFGTNPKYKYKPLWSAGAAWNIHRENFMQDISWITQLKLRAAYGFNGNVAKLSLPEVIARSVLNYNTLPASPALTLVSYANSSLRWEQTKSFNTGLDYIIFKNVSGSIDYYRKKSTDLLGNVLIDPTIGISPSLINQATIVNKGLEFGLRADWIATKSVNWNTGIVAARNTSKVLEVYQKGDFSPQTLNALGYVKNYPVGAMFSYRSAGLDDEGYPLISNTAGKKFRTTVEEEDATRYLMASDTSGLSHYTGSSIPTINAGLSNRLDIGNFYIFCMINYYGGFKVRVPRPNPSSSRPLKGAGNYWKVKGDEQTTDVMALGAYYSANANNAYNYSDSYVVNGDYMTLGDLTVSYSLDQFNFIKRAGFTHFEVKCQASNLWTVGLNRRNFSMATGSYQKSYLTPTYTIGIFTNF